MASSNSVKNAILRKKINDIVTDLMVKTTIAMVFVDDTKTLATYLTELQGNIKTNTDKLEALLGTDSTGSLTEQINNAITEAIGKVTNEETSGSLGYRVKALEAADKTIIASVASAITTANNYTDTKLGYGTDDSFTDVKTAIASLKTELTGMISGAFHYKGTVDYVDDLDSTSYVTTKTPGDVYTVKYAGERSANGQFLSNKEYVYVAQNGSISAHWEEIGGFVDLSEYAKTTEVTNTITSKLNEITNSTGTGSLDIKIKEAKDAADKASSDLESYKTAVTSEIDEAVSGAKTELTNTINNTKTELTTAINTAKTEAITEAGNNADTKDTAVKNELTPLINAKGKFIVSSEEETATTLGDNDLWAYIIEDSGE